MLLTLVSVAILDISCLCDRFDVVCIKISDKPLLPAVYKTLLTRVVDSISWGNGDKIRSFVEDKGCKKRILFKLLTNYIKMLGI